MNETDNKSQTISGDFYSRPDQGYEAARRAAVWNGRKPDRYPDHILVAANAEDVVRGVRFGKAQGLKIGIRSGGHSVVATGVREGGLLIDLSRLSDIEIDVDSKRAWIGPGVRGRQLGLALRAHDLTFPYGGSPSVGLGGYLLTGGYGLNGKMLGSGTSNIMAIEVVTADGELIYADETTNPDLLWAARGGGYGFFGVVVRFQLRVHDAPGCLSRAAYTFSVDDFDAFGDWFFDAMPSFDRRLMTLIFGVKHPDLIRNVVRITSLSFGDTEEETRELFRPLEASPIVKHALSRTAPARTSLEEIWAGVDLLYPERCRYFADTCWINDPSNPAFTAAIKPAFTSLPTRYSHVMINPWVPEERDDAALSGTTALPFHMYGVGESVGEDELVQSWITRCMANIVPLSNGIGKVNESDLLLRPQHVLAPTKALKLETLRAKYDPNRLFHSFLRQE